MKWLNSIKKHINSSEGMVWSMTLYPFLVCIKVWLAFDVNVVIFVLCKEYGHDIELRMGMGNVSKRQQPEQRADNSQRPPMGLPCIEKISHLEACFSLPQNKNVISSVIMDVILNCEIYKETRIKNHTRLLQAKGSWLGTGAKLRRG